MMWPLLAVPDPLQCPLNLRAGLKRYVNDRLPTGGFLRAVLENDLRTALRLADPESFAHMRDLMEYIADELPALAYGSPERVAAWLRGRS